MAARETLQTRIPSDHADARANVDAQVDCLEQNAVRSVSKRERVDEHDRLLQRLARRKGKGKFRVVDDVAEQLHALEGLL